MTLVNTSRDFQQFAIDFRRDIRDKMTNPIIETHEYGCTLKLYPKNYLTDRARRPPAVSFASMPGEAIPPAERPAPPPRPAAIDATPHQVGARKAGTAG